MNIQAASFWVRWRLFLLYYRKAKAQSLTTSFRVLLKPDRVVFHLRRMVFGDTGAWGNFYVPSASRADEVRFCCEITGEPIGAVERVFGELEENNAFIGQLRDHYNRVRQSSPILFNVGRLKVWYSIVRLAQPDVVMETGVHDGLSTALILHAMRCNGRGTLVSIDLPSVDLPISVEGPGWLVPEDLCARWQLHIGDARKLLPHLAKQYAPIDIFIHDSDHSREFQRFEYEAVRGFQTFGSALER